MNGLSPIIRYPSRGQAPEIFAMRLKKFGKLNILVSNAGAQHPQDDMKKITKKQLTETFNTNIFPYFYMIKSALPYLKKGSAIINTSSVTCYKGSDHLIDYSATKGAIVALTRSLSNSLIPKGIRVNAVAPGPVWTPLIEATFSKKHIKQFGKNVPMKRAGQPEEIAPSYVFLASDDSSYMSGPGITSQWWCYCERLIIFFLKAFSNMAVVVLSVITCGLINVKLLGLITHWQIY